ncbi:MAG: helix-turn-helix domain-containing protein [Sphaerochaeta sp.]|nr:helix-turn-helix domain-containing protein [Sphaerochaeta sp.]
MIANAEVPRGVRDITSHYSKATGIPCMVLDVLHHTLLDVENSELETLFSLIDSTWKDHCLETHLHSAVLSERFGGSYIYFGLISMLYWVSPVIIDGRMDYAIIAGPVMTLDSSEVLEEAVVAHIEEKDELMRILDSLTHIDINRVHSLSEVLRMCSGWASGYSEHHMVETRQSLELQSRLSENIQQLKSESKDQIHCYPIEKESALQDAIRWGDKAKAMTIMNELLGIIFFSSGDSLERISFRVMEILSILSRAAVRGVASEEDVLTKSLACQKEIRQYSSLEGISAWLAKVLHSYMEMVFVSMDSEYNPTIAKALRYIHANYSGHLSLEEAAHSAQLSPNYFSSLFNTRMGVSFSSYVNKVRIEHAQRLLLDTSFPIIEIASLVGFEEQSYFSKVFKEKTNLSPGKYRKQAGHFPSNRHEIHTEDMS